MSLITEQIKELNECAKKCQQYPFINFCMNNEGHDFRFIFRNAADTIKTLSEKVRAKKALEERKTGKWIPVKGYEGILWECSECHDKMHHTTIKWSYCPDCGARMVEPQERSGEE